MSEETTGTLDQQLASLEARFSDIEKVVKAAPTGGGSTVSTSCCTHSCPCFVPEEEAKA